MLTPFAVEAFGGLNLRDDPEEVGLNAAVDLLNVDFDRYGLVRQRDGYAKFTSSAATNRYGGLCPYYSKAQTVTQLLAGRSTAAARGIEVLDTAGAVVTSATSAAGWTDLTKWTFAPIGTPAAEYVYVSGWSNRTATAGSTSQIWRYDGTSLTTPFSGAAETSPIGCVLGVSPVDNRLVIARESSPTQYDSRVRFSDPGAPETFGANNYVDVTPGDGEYIVAAVTWGTLLLVFKQTKMFVFYGNGTDDAGLPIFNYRMVDLACSMTGAAVATPAGVYFAARDGLYVTTGGPPARVSNQIAPLFNGNPSALFASSTINQSQIQISTLAWVNTRLYFAYPAGSGTVNDRVVVYDPASEVWSLWGLPAAAITPFRVSGDTDLLFAYSSGTNDLGRLKFVSPSTDDAGTQITSRYRSGFGDLGAPGTEKTIRETEVVGTGTVGLAWSRDFGTVPSATNVTLGTSPAVARGLQRTAQRGELLSYSLTSVSGGAWRVDRLTPMMRVASTAGARST